MFHYICKLCNFLNQDQQSSTHQTTHIAHYIYFCHFFWLHSFYLQIIVRELVGPVTTAWRVLRLRIEERPPIRRVAANKLNKQSRTAEEGWSSSSGVGRGANKPSLLKQMFSNTHMRDDTSGHKTIRRYTSPTLGSPGGSVSTGIVAQHTKRYETRYVEC